MKTGCINCYFLYCINNLKLSENTLRSRINAVKHTTGQFEKSTFTKLLRFSKRGAENSAIEKMSSSMAFGSRRVKCLNEHSTSHQLLCCIGSFVLRNLPLRQAPNCCTKASPRSPFVQRAAAAPPLHKVLPPVALCTTAVLRNSKKIIPLRSIFFVTSQSLCPFPKILQKPQ
jgi:hypothetical protein